MDTHINDDCGPARGSYLMHNKTSHVISDTLYVAKYGGEIKWNM